MNGDRRPSGNDTAWADRRQCFVEEMSALVLVSGTPRAVLRVFGWMAVCEPHEQTAADGDTCALVETGVDELLRICQCTTNSGSAAEPRITADA